MIFLTADLHLGHQRVIEYSNRPFVSVDDMDATILRNINNKVFEKDFLYILGDFTFGGIEKINFYLGKIKCKNVFLVKGNHDHRSAFKADFSWVRDIYELTYNNLKYVLFHYPMVEWNASFHGSRHCYGHIHNNPVRFEARNSLNVGVDVCDYKPLSMEEVELKFG